MNKKKDIVTFEDLSEKDQQMIVTAAAAAGVAAVVAGLAFLKIFLKEYEQKIKDIQID